MNMILLLSVRYIKVKKRCSCSLSKYCQAGEHKPADAAELLDFVDGPANNPGTAEAGRRPGRGEDDPDHLRLQAHPAPHGGVRLPQGLHFVESR